ncbi:YoaK family protein [Streptomyces sp. NPDC006372]|uniref:YoaK family protein n=1 Tax=Streptomyces sp. NPDC006372 TaxID=3155599 RepID=UPI0033B270EB
MSDAGKAPSLASDARRVGVMTVLTVLAGAVDAVSFLTMGKVFCALLTGNVLFLSFALAGEGQVPVARPAVAIAAFMAGAAVADVVLKRLAARGRDWFPAGLVCEAVLLVTAGVLTLAEHGTEAVADVDDHTVVALVALAMGVRASTVLRVHVPGMPTLLSQTAIAELIDDVLRRPQVALHGMTAGQRLARTRWTATVGGIFTGGVLGTLWLVPLGTGRALLVIAAAVLLLAAATAAVRSRAEKAGRRPKGT